MAFAAKDVLSRARELLLDPRGHRWPLVELLGWLNDGMHEILIFKPTAFTKTVDIGLVAGTKQTLPNTYANLVRVINNVSGRAIRTTDRESLDEIGIDWHNASVVPFSRLVMHVAADTSSPRDFWVYPGNDGSGFVSAIVAVKPVDLEPPADGAAQLNVDAYDADIELDEFYRNPLTDYVCYRAFSKDMLINGKDARAMAHAQAFARSLGARQQAEFLANINTDGQEPAARGG